MFPMLVFQLSTQQNRTRTTSTTVLGTLRTALGQRNSPWKSFEAVALLVGFSTGTPPKIKTLPLGTVHETVLGHLLNVCHLCGAQALLPHQCRILPVPFPPVKKCPSFVANPLATYRSLSGPPGLRSQKSLKKVSRSLRPRGPKKSGKVSTIVRNRHFRDFWDFGPGGPRDSCSSREGLQEL